MFKRIGPYHRARLNAAAREMDLLAIECSSVDRVYRWKPVEGGDFRRVTLFRDDDVATKSPDAIMKKLRSVLEAEVPEVIAIPGWSSPSALAGLLLSREYRIPAVMMSDSTAKDAPRRFFPELVKRRLLRLCGAALVAGTPHGAYLADLGFPADRTFYGYDVVDNEHFVRGSAIAHEDEGRFRKQYSLPDRYFLASARFIPKKNLPSLLLAYRQFRRAWDGEEIHLVILGDGELRGELLGHIEKLNLSTSVRLPGFGQYEDLPIYYGLATAFIHSSTVEQWGLVVNEAMAAGLPVLVSDRCGCAEDLVLDGANGYRFPPDDPAALASSMLRVVGDERTRLEMGNRSREIVAQWGLERFSSGLREAARVAISGPKPTALPWPDRVFLQSLMRKRIPMTPATTVRR